MQKTYDCKPLIEEDEHVSKYAMLLNRKEWKLRRIEILRKDKFKCTKCFKSSTLKVRKGCYIKGLEELGRLHNGKILYKSIYTDEKIVLHIHHTFYVLERPPWMYEDEHLITLCSTCHKQEHKKYSIAVYNDEISFKQDIKSKIITCPRCGGNGYLDEYHYHEDGVCFLCMGGCFVEIIPRLDGSGKYKLNKKQLVFFKGPNLT